MPVLWSLLGAWTLSSGQTWLGVAQLALAAAFLAYSLSSRSATPTEAPLSSRK